MNITVIKTPGLAHLSYVLSDGGEAAVIDPRIDLDAYLDATRGLRIQHIFETHRHEDFVSGARALSERTGAPVHHGTALDFGHGRGAEDGERIRFGKLELEVLHTPGHTDESISIAVRHCETGESVLGVFTGDALFVGDVGRTDFYPERAREVAGLLYDSLHDKILPLGDQAVVWPAHGAGSVCGDGMADRDFTTIGYERAHNDRLQLDREAFIQAKLSEEHDYPPYFNRMERVNKRGHEGLAHLPLAPPVPPDGLEGRLIDVRAPEAWAGCHIAGSLCLPASMIPAWAGWWLDDSEPLSLVGGSPDTIDDAVRHLTRLGYTRVQACLRDGIGAWETSGKRIRSAPGMHVDELYERRSELTILDVRKPDAFAEGHVEGAIVIPLAELTDRYEEVPSDKPVVTLCGSGRRATIAASLLLQRGFDDVRVCFGSMAAWRARGLPTVE